MKRKLVASSGLKPFVNCKARQNALTQDLLRRLGFYGHPNTVDGYPLYLQPLPAVDGRGCSARVVDRPGWRLVP